jgi:aryl-alcohol dehydrogenase-like predicted oxidoreductase
MNLFNIKNTIIIGTAQLGANYGIANTNKNIFIKNKIELLELCYKHNLHHFDTAYAYENSHKIIGKWIKKYNTSPIINTKIPNLQDNKNIEFYFYESLKQLNIIKIKNLFLHNPLDWNKKEVKEFIINIIGKNQIAQFGLSIYETKEVINDTLVKILQVPGNIFNQDILLSEEINKFTSNGGKIQIRSVLIQGLLMMEPTLIPSNMEKTKAGVSYFQDTAKELNINKVHLAILCINYLLPEAEIIIGIDNKAQVKDLLSINRSYIKNSDIKEILKECKAHAGDHWDPRNW